MYGKTKLKFSDKTEKEGLRGYPWGDQIGQKWQKWQKFMFFKI